MSVVDRFTLNIGDFEIVSESIEKHGTGDQTAHGNWARGRVSVKLTQSILDKVKANGGLSVNMRDGSEPNKGYMVASPVKQAPVVDADDFFNPVKGRKILADFVKANKKDLGGGKKYLGLWHNEKDNKVYLDVSENVQDKAKAVQLGKERNQISIWDVVNFDEIQTGGTGVTEKGRSEGSGSTIEYIGYDGRADRQLGEFGLRQVSEVGKHSTHDQSSHAGDRGKGNKNPKGEEEVTDPNAPKPKLKPGRKPDASGSLEERADKLAKGERIQVTKSEAKKIMKIMAKRDDDPDLTNMHIENTLLYDEDNLGIPRNKMPQVPSDTKAVFVSEMQKRGARVQRGVADPAKLHPIQKEMSASKVGLIMKRLREKGMKTGDDGRIIISKDNYVIDGHHRWAAAAMLSFEDSSVKIPVIRVDMNHKDLISATLAWNEASGIQSIGIGERNPKGQLKKWAEFDAIVAKAVRGRTVIRFQPGLKPVMKHQSHDQQSHGNWASEGGASKIVNNLQLWNESELSKFSSSQENQNYLNEKMLSQVENGFQADSFKKVVRTYQGAYGREINEALRDPLISEEQWQDDIDGLDNAIKAAPGVSEPTIVYRGIRGNGLDFFNSLKSGDVFQDKGFISTTLDTQIAFDFATAGNLYEGVVMKIKLPIGSKGLFPAGVTGLDFAGYESEFILPRDSKLKIVNNEGKVWDVEVVND